jgi:hypothetical protein
VDVQVIAGRDEQQPRTADLAAHGPVGFLLGAVDAQPDAVVLAHAVDDGRVADGARGFLVSSRRNRQDIPGQGRRRTRPARRSSQPTHSCPAFVLDPGRGRSGRSVSGGGRYSSASAGPRSDQEWRSAMSWPGSAQSPDGPGVQEASRCMPAGRIHPGASGHGATEQAILLACLPGAPETPSVAVADRTGEKSPAPCW